MGLGFNYVVQESYPTRQPSTREPYCKFVASIYIYPEQGEYEVQEYFPFAWNGPEPRDISHVRSHWTLCHMTVSYDRTRQRIGIGIGIGTGPDVRCPLSRAATQQYCTIHQYVVARLPPLPFVPCGMSSTIITEMVKNGTANAPEIGVVE